MKLGKTERDLRKKLRPALIRIIEDSTTLHALAKNSFLKGESAETIENNLRVLDYFFSWMKKSADQAVRDESNWSENIRKFAAHLLNERRLSTTTVANQISSIRKFIRANKVPMKDGPTFLPKKVRRERDRIPTRQELKRIFSKAEDREKAIMLFSLTSGLGLNSLRQLSSGALNLNKTALLYILDGEITQVIGCPMVS